MKIRHVVKVCQKAFSVRSDIHNAGGRLFWVVGPLFLHCLTCDCQSKHTHIMLQANHSLSVCVRDCVVSWKIAAQMQQCSSIVSSGPASKYVPGLITHPASLSQWLASGSQLHSTIATLIYTVVICLSAAYRTDTAYGKVHCGAIEILNAQCRALHGRGRLDQPTVTRGFPAGTRLKSM